MLLRLRRLPLGRLLTIFAVLAVFLAFPAIAFAQDDGGGGLDISWGVVLGGLITGTLIPLAVQFLIYLWPKAPTLLKAIAGPVLVPLLAFAGATLSNMLGVEIDFTPIIVIIIGAGAASSLAFKMGKSKGLRKRKR